MKLEPAYYALFTLFLVAVYFLGDYLSGPTVSGHSQYMQERSQRVANTPLKVQHYTNTLTEKESPNPATELVEEKHPRCSLESIEENRSKSLMEFVKAKKLEGTELIIRANIGRRVLGAANELDGFPGADVEQVGHSFNINQVAKGDIDGKAATIYIHRNDFKKYFQFLPERNEFITVYTGFNRYESGGLMYWKNVSCVVENETIWLLSWMAHASN